MNKKNLLIGSISILLIALVVWAVLHFAGHSDTSTEETQPSGEYTPQEEMSDDEMRKTIVSLYFKNIETNTLTPESVTIDVKELTENPYKKLMDLLLSGPSNEKLECPLPENTKVNNAYLTGDTVYVDFSSEFVDNAPSGAEEESLVVYSVVNTLTELNEVNQVKILINGDADRGFKDGAISFKEAFVRND